MIANNLKKHAAAPKEWIRKVRKSERRHFARCHIKLETRAKRRTIFAIGGQEVN